MIMGQDWVYERRFDVIISNHPYWNYHGFFSALRVGGTWVFQCLGVHKKLLDCRLQGKNNTQGDTIIKGKHNFMRKKLLGTNQGIKFFSGISVMEPQSNLEVKENLNILKVIFLRGQTVHVNNNRIRVIWTIKWNKLNFSNFAPINGVSKTRLNFRSQFKIVNRQKKSTENRAPALVTYSCEEFQFWTTSNHLLQKNEEITLNTDQKLNKLYVSQESQQANQTVSRVVDISNPATSRTTDILSALEIL